jgi:3-oxoadipate enol-lactonase
MNTTQSVRVKSGAKLSYVDVGQGLPVILIHGLFLDDTAFEAQIQAFADRYRIIALDIHGHGASSELDRSMLLDDMAEQVNQLLAQLLSGCGR